MRRKGERAGDVRVDDADHAALAVLGLRAVVPDGFGVVDCQDEGGVLLMGMEGSVFAPRGFAFRTVEGTGVWETYSRAGMGGDEAGVYAMRGGLAWGVEVALHDGVVLHVISLICQQSITTSSTSDHGLWRLG